MNEEEKLKLEKRKQILLAIRSAVGSVRLEPSSNICDSELNNKVQEFYKILLKSHFK